MIRTIFSMITLILAISVSAQGFVKTQSINDPVFYNTSNSKATDCEQSNPSFNFENGRGCSANNNWTAANDYIVAANESFILKQISANIMVLPGDLLTSVDVFYYDDNAGLPGAIIGSQLAVAPNTQNIIGSAFGYDVREMILNIIPFAFYGQLGSTKTYWIGIQTTDSGGGDNYWEDSTDTAIGNPLAFDSGSGYTIPAPANDGVYTFSGTCLTTCDHFNPESTFEGGYFSSPNGSYRVANDITINPDENFSVEEITANIWTQPGVSITNVDVTYYGDNAGLPGVTEGTENAVNIVSQDVIGTNGPATWEIHELVLDLTPFTLVGQAGNSTTYWIELYMTNSVGDGYIAWGYNSGPSNNGHPLAQYNDVSGAWAYPSPTYDGVYIFSGHCSGLGVNDDIIEGFEMYPNPVKDMLTIEAANKISNVTIYNILGQEVLRNTPFNKQVKMDISSLHAGSYIAKVQVGDQIGSHMLIKQ